MKRVLIYQKGQPDGLSLFQDAGFLIPAPIPVILLLFAMTVLGISLLARVLYNTLRQVRLRRLKLENLIKPYIRGFLDSQNENNKNNAG